MPDEGLGGIPLRDLFRLEAEGQTAILATGLLSLERSSAPDPAAIEPLMRAAHSLKGAARVVGLDSAERIAHALEDCLIAAQDHSLPLTGDRVDTLLASVDLIAVIAQVQEAQAEQWERENAPRVQSIVRDLERILAGPEAPDPIPTPGAAEAPAPAPAEPLPAPEISAEAPPPAPPEANAPAEAIPLPPAADRVVRVGAENLTRVMALAGESLVVARHLRPILDGHRAVQRLQEEFSDCLAELEDCRAEGLAADHPRIGRLLERGRRLVASSRDEFSSRLERLEAHARRGEDLAGRLHREVIASRIRPLSEGIRGLPRLVRDVARQLGKKAILEVEGEETGVDRDILDKLEAPLTHLVRNALDHGLETPDEREAAGKPEAGTIRLEAAHRAGMLRIALRDDGRGVDLARLRATIAGRGLAPPELVGRFGTSELLDFLLLPGFSTRDEVTDLSGRGVGLDVVRTMIRAVGGSLAVHSEQGRGMEFVLQLPVTMSVIRALLVRIGGEPYAFPLMRLERIRMAAAAEVERLEGRPFLTIDGRAVGLVGAEQVLGISRATPAASPFPVVVFGDESQAFGMIVEAILGECDLNVRPLDPRLGRVPNISSVAVLEDGLPVPILDVEDLARSIENLVARRRLAAPALAGESRPEGGHKAAPRILVVDDSITVRELERQLLEGRGYEVDLAVDGVDGWNALQSGRYDLVVSDVDMPRMDGVQMIRLIRGEPRLRHVPVVIVSYKERAEDRLRGLEAGANSYLTKGSFHDDTFLETVADLIGEPPGGGKLREDRHRQ
jgi:two-component system sensor histidine kinase and response regulator WspE